MPEEKKLDCDDNNLILIGAHYIDDLSPDPADLRKGVAP
jgi:hypothetical protein